MPTSYNTADKSLWRWTNSSMSFLSAPMRFTMVWSGFINTGRSSRLIFIGTVLEKKTVAQLIEQGVPCSPYALDGAMNSEALLQTKSLQQLAQQKVLIIRGVGGRDYLAEQLTQRGADVSYAECYRRVLPALADGELVALFKQQAINTVCLNSGESVTNFYQLMGDNKISDITIVVPGDRVAAIAKQLGFSSIAIADNASDQSMLKALYNL